VSELRFHIVFISLMCLLAVIVMILLRHPV
jgi:hypothetical protein